MNTPRLFLIDAMALVFRAHFVFIRNPRITTKGVNTSAVYGFTNTVLDILTKEKPSHLGVAFESQKATFREEFYEAYKGNRQETPEDIKVAVPYIMRILEAMKIPILSAEGYEADDVIGTLSHKAAKEKVDVYMLTPDKDYAQLVQPHVYLYRPSTGPTPYEVIDEQGVVQRYGVRPDQIVDLLGLKGDAVDNIPGVPKIGEKTALQLIEEFGSIEGVYQNLDKITKKAVKATLEENKEKADLSKYLAKIALDAPIELDLHALEMCEPDYAALSAIFDELEFKTLKNRIIPQNPATPQVDLFNAAPQKPVAPKPKAQPVLEETNEDNDFESNKPLKRLPDVPHNYKLLEDEGKMKELVAEILNQPAFCFDTETTSIEAQYAEIVGLSLAFQAGEAFYIPFGSDFEESKKRLAIFEPLFSSKTIEKIGQNVKYDLTVLGNYGFKVEEPLFDTMLAHYACHSGGRHGMDLLAKQFLDYEPIPISDLIGAKGKKQKSMRDLEPAEIVDYACEDADVTLQLAEKMKAEIEKTNVENLFHKIEMPLVPVLYAMEREGVRIDRAFLDDYSLEMQKELEAMEADIYRLSGVKFNLNSPRQLGEVLYDVLKLGDAKKTKTGQYATGEEILVELAAKGHELPAKMLEYREITKLKSTYIDTLPTLINPKTGRVHTTFNQTVAVTGRLSSNNPNLQNIPIKTDRGREIRKAFIARDENHLIIAADYSQIELRIMASMSGDSAMIEAFRNNEDIHTATAAKVFGVSKEDVTSDMRRKSKMVNFGIIYGITAFGLSQRLGIKRGEAGEIIANYFAQYPGVKDYMNACVEMAREKGYAQTLGGRKHYLRDIHSANQTTRSFAERNAINTPIQGSAADMIKLAMIDVYKMLNEKGFKTRMILQVHDELLFDAPKDEIETVKPFIVAGMQNALPLQVPVEVGLGVGENWLDAH